MFIHLIDCNNITVQTFMDGIFQSKASFKDIENCLKRKRFASWFCSYNQISAYLFWKHLTISV